MEKHFVKVILKNPKILKRFSRVIICILGAEYHNIFESKDFVNLVDHVDQSECKDYTEILETLLKIMI